MMRLIFLPLWLLHWLPLQALWILGRLLGRMAFALARERRQVTLTNLALCFPQWSPEQRHKIALRHFQGFVTSALSLGIAWFASESRLRRMVQYTGLEHVRAAQQHGPVILLTPHFFGVDTIGPFLTLDFDVITINSRQKNPALEALIRSRRLRWGKGLIFARQDSLRGVLKALKPGWLLYYLPDQDFGPKDSLFVDFFGVKAATVPALARMARLAKAQVVPCVVHQNFAQGRFDVSFYPPWEEFPSGNDEVDTLRMNHFIEARILEQPAHYLWSHKRFKTRPPGESSVYELRP
ncbi:MAG: lysophospholipid acyltransferase family protein [Ferrovum sp.]|nr:lysophospholipid acyltransferase family protein [Ferrovum sp.]NDU86665.1 lysophospholipid acyltransferase family protein [Ferrovum sp.]